MKGMLWTHCAPAKTRPPQQSSHLDFQNNSFISKVGRAWMSNFISTQLIVEIRWKNYPLTNNICVARRYSRSKSGTDRWKYRDRNLCHGSFHRGFMSHKIESCSGAKPACFSAPLSSLNLKVIGCFMSGLRGTNFALYSVSSRAWCRPFSTYRARNALHVTHTHTDMC